MVNLISWAKKILQDAGNPSAAFDVRQLLGMFTDSVLDPCLSPQQEKGFIDCVCRRAAGEPLQYILGEWEFMSLPFKINPGVLIPRQDTEVLCETALQMTDGKKCRVLDLCCGSGCIGIALAYYNKNAHVTAVDISDKAILLTEENAALNAVADRMEIKKADVLTDNIEGKFDFIVSNPPYIKSGDIQGLQKEVVMYEPHIALDGGDNGLVFYRTLIEKFTQNLREGGAFLFELGVGQGTPVSSMFDSRFNISVKKDLNGVNRVIVAKLL